jgi:hypothetical protein
LGRHAAGLLPSILLPSVKVSTESTKSALLSSTRLFECDIFVVQLVNFLAILATFGVVFPPLALVALVATFSVTTAAQLSIGRFVLKSRTESALDTLEADCSGARVMFLQSLWMAAPFTLLFYSFLLFDILGDTLGYKRAVWLPLGLVSAPLLVWLGVRFKQYTIFGKMDRHSRRSWSGTGGVIELDPREFPAYGPLSQDLLDDDLVLVR